MMKKAIGKAGLQVKIVGIASMVTILALLVTQIIGIAGMRGLGISVALTMGERALNGYMHLFDEKISREHGELRLVGGALVDEDGHPIANDFMIVDAVNAAVGTQATISVREGNNFRRISTSITDARGSREVDTYLTQDNSALAPLLAGQHFRDRTYILGVEHLAYYRPILAQNGRDVIGFLAVATEMGTIFDLISQEVDDQIVSAIISAVIILIVAVILLALSCLFMLIRPIASAVDMLREISEGEGDLTKKLHVSSGDEIGRMAHYFNLTLDRIRGLVVSIREQAFALSDIGTELASNMTQTAAAVNEIDANTQSIQGRVMSQSASVTQTNATMEQVTMNIDRLNGHIEMQASAVNDSSSSIEQMIANVKSVTNTLARNAENVRELEEASEIGRAGLSDVAADIQGIARESESLLEINSVMHNIASQTNLLSMNAAIEAAHAGESGKGFAVVADEIRKLAESSSEQSKTISGVLKKIKESIDKITRSTDSVLNKFEAIDSGVKTVAEQENTILRAMEEQGQGSQRVLHAIGQVSDITGNVRDGSRQMLEGSKEVIAESKNLERVTQEITGGMSEMAAGANQINIAVDRVKELSSMNRNSIENLLKEVSKFKVE